MSPDHINTEEFFDKLRPWGFWKHQILSKYLHVFVRKLGRQRDLIVFVDGCAGAGRYDTGEDGSPIIAAKKNDQELRDKRKRLLVVACEELPNLVTRLQEAMAPWTSRNPPEAIVLPGKFESHLPEIVELTKGVPTLFFIDACNNAPPSQLSEILRVADRGHTELLVRFSPNDVARWAGKLRRGQKAMRDRLAEFVRPDLLQSLEAMPEDEGNPVFMESFHEEYRALLRARFRYVQSIAIREDHGSAPKYWLEHATQSPDGAALMNDIVSTTIDEQFEQTITTAANENDQTSLFDPLENVVQRPPVGAPFYLPVDLTNAIRTSLADGKPRPVVEVRAELAIHLGPQFRKRDHMAEIRRLLTANQLRSPGKVTEDWHQVQLV